VPFQNKEFLAGDNQLQETECWACIKPLEDPGGGEKKGQRCAAPVVRLQGFEQHVGAQNDTHRAREKRCY
jgi:hypothetical protein